MCAILKIATDKMKCLKCDLLQFAKRRVVPLCFTLTFRIMNAICIENVHIIYTPV